MSSVYLLDPSSTLVTNILTKGKISLGTANKFNATTNYFCDISGAYSSNTVTAMQIPADTSNNRPTVPVKGYIRYNTTIDLLEFWNGTAWRTLLASGSYSTLTVTGYILNSTYTVTYTDNNNNIITSPTTTGYTIYSFTGTGITGAVVPSTTMNVTYMVIGGGGSGGTGNTSYYGGGGGAGGFRCDVSYGLLVGLSYNVSVGAGGTFPAGNDSNGNTGSASSFATITADGGGGGGYATGVSGGSGGGGAYYTGASLSYPGGSGNSPGAYTPIEGFGGGAYSAGGQGAPGGGAVGTGNNSSTAGGIGATNSLSGVSVTYASGGY